MEEDEKLITFPEAFHYCITHSSADVYNSPFSKIDEYCHPFHEFEIQYSETLKDLLSSHSEIVETYSKKADLSPIQQQHDEEVTAMHENWSRQYESLHSTQSKVFHDYIFELYNSVAISKTFNKHMTASQENMNISPEGAESNELKDSFEIKSLMEMGFDRKMARSALKMAKDNLERAIMLLLENPKGVEEHANLKDHSITPLGSPLLLRKSNSFFNVGRDTEAGDVRIIPPIDWGKKRSSSFKSVNKSNPPNPFKNMGVFLEKAMDAFRTEDTTDESIITKSQKNTNLSESFTAHIGTQQIRTMYNMHLCVKSFPSLFTPLSDRSQAHAIRNSTLQSLYSKSLSGLIILLKKDEIRSYGPFSGRLTSNSDFFKACNRNPELHFPSVGNQISDIKKEYLLNEKADIEEGDFFITRHSNLSSIHIVFHLITNDDQDLSSQSNLIQGYRSILYLSHLCHVTQLTIPLTLSLNPSDVLTSVHKKRVEMILKQSKGVFTELSRHSGIDHVSRQIIFILPENDAEQIFISTKEKLLNIFKI